MKVTNLHVVWRKYYIFLLVSLPMIYVQVFPLGIWVDVMITLFDEKIGIFLKNQCFDPIFSPKN
jgi:hypothetical protein